MLKPYDVEQADRSSGFPHHRRNAEEVQRSPRKAKVTKLFVLDTNVLMHDPASLFRFEEHDLYLPMGTLEELDSNKKGLSDVARNARQASRFLDEIVSRQGRRHRRGPADPHARERPARGRAPVPADRGDQRRPAGDAAGGQDRQPDPVGGAPPAEEGSAARRDPGVQGHQHAHQGARARPRRRGLLQRQGAGGHRPPLHRRAQARGRLLGQRTARTSSPGRRTATPTTACAARWCRSCS